MKALWNIMKLSSFDKVDMKGLGRWIFASFVLFTIVSRMNMRMVHGTIEVSPSLMIFLPCIGIYFTVYNRLINLPQFLKDRCYTAVQEIRISIYLLASCFVIIYVFNLILSMIAVLTGSLDMPKINIRQEMLNSLPVIFFYLFITALLFPLGLIRDKKKWYLSFGAVALVMEAISLVLINLSEEGSGFRTSGDVFTNVSSMDHYSILTTIMGTVTVVALFASYQISQRMYAPKRYDTKG